MTAARVRVGGGAPTPTFKNSTHDRSARALLHPHLTLPTCLQYARMCVTGSLSPSPRLEHRGADVGATTRQHLLVGVDTPGRCCRGPDVDSCRTLPTPPPTRPCLASTSPSHHPQPVACCDLEQQSTRSRQRARPVVTVMSRSLLTVVVMAAAVAAVCVCGVGASVSAGEHTALNDFRTLMGSPAVLSSWATGDPCTNSWTGVTCQSTTGPVT